MSKETVQPQFTPMGVANLGQRGATQQTVSGQTLLAPGSSLVDQNGPNTMNLQPGAFAGYVQSKAVTVSGVAGTSLAGATYTTAAKVQSVDHTGGVTLGPGTQAVFIGCDFTDVACTVGAKARFIGCRISGNINNAGGVITDVVLIGCFMNGVVTNCTVIG